MVKSATVQARVDLQMKKKVDFVLKQIGVSPSQVINALYAQIVLRKGIPFELTIPNEATQQAVSELEKGDGKRFSSFNEMLDDLEEDDA